MKLVVANTKMYLNSLKEIENYQNEMENYKNDFVIAPQSIYLESFKNKGFTVASQNVSDNDKGPFTGEISSRALAEIGTDYVIVGHSEIRGKYSDENNYIKDKVKKSLDNKLKVILCVGESSFDIDNVYSVLDRQLKDIEPNNDLIISYEPIWAIGGRDVMENSDLEKIINYIKKKGFKRVMYGGSVNENNIRRLKYIDNLDGFLIGSASVNPDLFKIIIEVVK